MRKWHGPKRCHQLERPESCGDRILLGLFRGRRGRRRVRLRWGIHLISFRKWGRTERDSCCTFFLCCTFFPLRRRLWFRLGRCLGRCLRVDRPPSEASSRAAHHCLRGRAVQPREVVAKVSESDPRERLVVHTSTPPARASLWRRLCVNRCRLAAFFASTVLLSKPALSGTALRKACPPTARRPRAFFSRNSRVISAAMY